MVAAAQKPSLRHLLYTAAERRVRGDDWKSIAEDLGYPEDKLMSLTYRYEEQWDKAYDWAEKNLSRETTAEVIHVLREEMRNDNLKIKLDATKAMLRWNMKMESRRPATARAVKPRVVIQEVEKEVVPAKYEEVCARRDELAKMSREELQKYANEVWENHPYTVELRNELETINREIDKLQKLSSVPYYGTAIGLLLALGAWLMLLAVPSRVANLHSSSSWGLGVWAANGESCPTAKTPNRQEDNHWNRRDAKTQRRTGFG